MTNRPTWTEFSTYSPDECWPWQGKISADGYGKKAWKMAHTLSYTAHVGPVPKGLQLDHLCHTRDLTCLGGVTCLHRRCVNPTHLEPVTHAENVRRGRRNGKPVGHLSTHCRNGHPFDEANTYTSPKSPTVRICRTCFRVNNLKWRAKRPVTVVKNHPALGAYWNPKKGKWRVRLTIAGKGRSFGYFATQDEALSRVQEIRSGAHS